MMSNQINHKITSTTHILGHKFVNNQAYGGVFMIVEWLKLSQNKNPPYLL